STHLYHRERLTRDHLLAIAARGFEAIEVFAARGHFDAAHPAAVADLQQWMAEARLELPSLLVPLDADAEQALLAARRIAVKVLAVQATTPRETAKAVERLAALAAPLQATIAVDSASMSPVGSLVHFVEAGVDAKIGICLDFAAAARAGDLVEAIETVA